MKKIFTDPYHTFNPNSPLPTLTFNVAGEVNRDVDEINYMKKFLNEVYEIRQVIYSLIESKENEIGFVLGSRFEYCRIAKLRMEEILSIMVPDLPRKSSNPNFLLPSEFDSKDQFDDETIVLNDLLYGFYIFEQWTQMKIESKENEVGFVLGGRSEYGLTPKHGGGKL